MKAGKQKTGKWEAKIESQRLATLGSYDVMDNAPEDAFQRITRLIADIFAAPMASISFIDKDREWFQSSVGLSETNADRLVSMCAHMIESREPIVIEDASVDSRFDSSPLVWGES
jgi:GAF domain-containing protein